MFPINDNKIIDTDLPMIVDNFRPLLVDESPILFAGTNRFGNMIVGSSVDEDHRVGVERYFHVIVEASEYFLFLKRKVTYLNLLRRARPFFILDKLVADDRYIIYEVSLEDVPAEYKPSEETLCPESIYTPSFQYTASMLGGLADTHRAVPQEVSQTQNSIAEAIRSAFATIRELFRIEEQVFLETSYSKGSFEINYEVRLKNFPSLFQKEDSYYRYLNEFLEYCFDSLPSEAERLASLQFEGLTSFNSLLHRLSELSIGNEVAISEIDVRESLVRDLRNSAQALHSASKDIGQGYKSIALRNGSGGRERPLGVITQRYRGEIDAATSILEDSTLLAAPAAALEEPKEHTIHIFQFHKMRGTGFAFLRDPQDETKQSIVRILIEPYEPISPNPYTHSLDQNIFIRVIGMLDSKGKSLTIKQHMNDS